MSQDQGSSNQVKWSSKNCTIFYFKATSKALKANPAYNRSKETNTKNDLRQINNGYVTKKLFLRGKNTSKGVGACHLHLIIHEKWSPL